MANETEDREQRSPTYSEHYANNVKFETTAWDIKMTFGQIFLGPDGKAQVKQHSTITIPWAEAKVMSYFLMLNLEGYQAENGPIQIPARVVPGLPIPPTTEELEKAPYNSGLYERIKTLYKWLWDRD